MYAPALSVDDDYDHGLFIFVSILFILFDGGLHLFRQIHLSLCVRLSHYYYIAQADSFHC